MNRNKIITEIYRSGIIKDLSLQLKTYIGERNIDDFICEIYQIICELNSDKLIKLYTNDQLTFYLISIVRNQARNQKSLFNKKYNNKIITYIPIIIEKDEVEEEYY